jgi:hypothetical protein
VNERDIKAAVMEAKRFIDAASKHLREDRENLDGVNIILRAGKNSGAVRRSSMDLTRSLAAMRGSL